MMYPKPFLSVLALLTLTACSAKHDNELSPDAETTAPLPFILGQVPHQWQLNWQDEFDYSNDKLDLIWDAQNSANKHILSSRWRENVVVENGELHLVNKKEQRGGQDWTSGSIRTKQQFGYGYYEARYKYAGASATNNSFWLMTYPMNQEPNKGKKFEIDINEGHFPNEVNTNIHNWSDISVDKNGRKTHPSHSKTLAFGAKHHYVFPLEIPITTKKLRFSSEFHKAFHIRKFNVFDSSNSSDNRTNFSKADDLTVTVSGHHRISSSEKNLLDNFLGSSWIAQESGEKWFEFNWQHDKTIKEIEFVNGWQDRFKEWKGLINNFKIQYFNGTDWIDIASLDIEGDINFAEQYHTYGLDWSEKELIFYFDGKEIRRERNDIAHSKVPIWLSLAIIQWDGPVTNKIDGTKMTVDYVRYFKHTKRSEPEL